MNKDFWKALFMRAIHAVWETAVSTMPAAKSAVPKHSAVLMAENGITLKHESYFHEEEPIEAE